MEEDLSKLSKQIIARYSKNRKKELLHILRTKFNFRGSFADIPQLNQQQIKTILEYEEHLEENPVNKQQSKSKSPARKQSQHHEQEEHKIGKVIHPIVQTLRRDTQEMEALNKYINDKVNNGSAGVIFVNHVTGQNLTPQQFEKRKSLGKFILDQRELEIFRKATQQNPNAKYRANIEKIIQDRLQEEEEQIDTRRIPHQNVLQEYERLQEQIMGLQESSQSPQIVNAYGASSQVPVGIVQSSKQEQMARWNKMLNKQYKQMAPSTGESLMAQYKIANKEMVRNGESQAANLAVVRNNIGIEEYHVKYPTIQEMLNLEPTRQLAFDLAQRKHMTMTQQALLFDILSNEQTYKPNIDFLRDKYEHSKLPEDLEKYNQAIINKSGTEFAYYGLTENDSQVLKRGQKASKIEAGAGPSLNPGLAKPEMFSVQELTKGIYELVDYISKLSGNLNKTDLSSYQKVEDVFGKTIVKKEPTMFRPQAGQGFKIRQLEC